MKNKVSIMDLTKEEISEINARCTKPGWRIIPKDEMPPVFRGSFRDKVDSVVAITSLTSTGGNYLVYSANRIDVKDGTNDIEPFGLIVNSTGPNSWGMFIHHGDWIGRNEVPPSKIWEEIEHSGIGNYYLSVPPLSKLEGTLEELPRGHREGFNEVIKAIRAHVDKE